MTSLSSHLYNISFGRIYAKSTEVTDTSFPGDVIADPPSTSDKLAITKISFQPSAAGVTVVVRSYESDGTTLVATLFNAVLATGILLVPPEVDMSDAPIILKDGQQLQATVSVGGTAYVTVRGFVL